MVDKVWGLERWDVGKWNSAHWNGQLGFNANQGQVVVTPQSATLRFSYALHATTLPIVVAPQSIALHYSLVLPAQTAPIIVDTTNTQIQFHVHYTLYATLAPLDIVVSRIWAELISFRQPVSMRFGIQRVVVPRRHI
jgi:hypothetical protein